MHEIWGTSRRGSISFRPPIPIRSGSPFRFEVGPPGVCFRGSERMRGRGRAALDDGVAVGNGGAKRAPHSAVAEPRRYPPPCRAASRAASFMRAFTSSLTAGRVNRFRRRPAVRRLRMPQKTHCITRRRARWRGIPHLAADHGASESRRGGPKAERDPKGVLSSQRRPAV